MLRRLLPALFALAAVLAPLCGAPAAAQIAVKGDWIALRDVAPVPGEGGEVLLGPAPPPGQTLALDPVFVMAVARRAGVILALPLDQPIAVSRAAAPGAGAVAPKAPAAREAPRAPLAASADMPAGAEPEEALPTRVLVLARDKRRGEPLSREDLDWAAPDARNRVRAPVREMELAIGMELRRNMLAGAALGGSDLAPARLVRKGEPVTLVYAAPSLRLTVQGVAQNDAALGEPVRVLNSQSRRAVDAVATAAAEARVSSR